MYGMMYIHDVFHVLYVCPIVTAERVAMWSALGQKGGAYEWEAAKTVCDLAYSLLCPQCIEVACVVGRFLAAYLAAFAMYNVASCDASLQKCSPKCLGGKTDVILGMREKIKSAMQSRSSGELSFPMCRHTHTWVALLSREPLREAFKPIRSWLLPGWAMNIEKKPQRAVRPIALF